MVKERSPSHHLQAVGQIQRNTLKRFERKVFIQRKAGTYLYELVLSVSCQSFQILPFGCFRLPLIHLTETRSHRCKSLFLPQKWHGTFT